MMRATSQRAWSGMPEPLKTHSTRSVLEYSRSAGEEGTQKNKLCGEREPGRKSMGKDKRERHRGETRENVKEELRGMGSRGAAPGSSLGVTRKYCDDVWSEHFTT